MYACINQFLSREPTPLPMGPACPRHSICSPCSAAHSPSSRAMLHRSPSSRQRHPGISRGWKPRFSVENPDFGQEICRKAWQFWQAPPWGFEEISGELGCRAKFLKKHWKRVVVSFWAINESLAPEFPEKVWGPSGAEKGLRAFTQHFWGSTTEGLGSTSSWSFLYKSAMLDPRVHPISFLFTKYTCGLFVPLFGAILTFVAGNLLSVACTPVVFLKNHMFPFLYTNVLNKYVCVYIYIHVESPLITINY